MTPLLKLSNVRAGYGESIVLHDLSIEIADGEAVCLLGANGAGKTTTTRVISGLIGCAGGQVLFEGRDLAAVPAHDRVNLGICLSPEGRQVFPNLSVEDNLLLGSYPPRARAARRKSLEEVFTLFPRLAERQRQSAGLFSGGEQQMLAIARAMMGKPRLLILDEPSLGLAPKIVLEVYLTIAKIASQGVSILFVEQNAQAALSVAGRGYVIANGTVAVSGSSAKLRASDLVREAFLGLAGTAAAVPPAH